MLQHLLVSTTITLPIIAMLLLGVWLRRQHHLDASFIQVGNTLVFRYCLPALLFLSTASNDIQQSFDGSLLGFGVAITLLSIVLLGVVGRHWWQRDRLRVVVQGGFRGNLGIVGVAMVLNAYGDAILPKVGIFFALLTLVYNVAAVLVLDVQPSVRKIIQGLARNPLIQAIVLGAAWSALQWPVSAVMTTTLNYLSSISLPLALICIGAGLQWRSFQANAAPLIWASLYKLVVMPLLAVVGALLLGFAGEDLGILFLMMATPSAAASYIMAKQMTDEGDLAGEIVVLTTLASGITTTLGLALLTSLDLLGL